MALGKIEQFTKALEDKKNILITFKKHFDGDAIGSSLALKLFLEQLNKRVDIVCADFVLPTQYSFLKHSQKISPRFAINKAKSINTMCSIGHNRFDTEATVPLAL